MKDETIRQRTITQALRSVGRIVLRTHSGKVRVKGGWMQQNESGTPDLHVVPNFYLETKTLTGSLSDDQKRVHEKIRRQGGVVAVVRTAAQALAVVVGKVKPEDLDSIADLLGEKPARVKA